MKKARIISKIISKKEKMIPVITPFQEKVYNITRNIPKGKTMTYGQIAKILNSSSRAVGQALKRNPFAPIVPCHRVIKSDGTLGGFNGKMNSRKKIRLLREEGVIFKDGKKEWNG